jgi:hypothetical protein
VDWANLHRLAIVHFWAVLMKITKVAKILGQFSHSKICAFILTKNWLGYIFGDFFANSSGHPANEGLFYTLAEKNAKCCSRSKCTRWIAETSLQVGGLWTVCPDILIISDKNVQKSRRILSHA